MKRSMWNMNNTLKNVNGTDKNDKDPSKRGMITGVGIGVVMVRPAGARFNGCKSRIRPVVGRI